MLMEGGGRWAQAGEGGGVGVRQPVLMPAGEALGAGAVADRPPKNKMANGASPDAHL